MQRDRKPPRGAWMGAAYATFQVGNAASTQPRSLGQSLLRQARGDAVLPQQLTELP
jgi:hypothetical protein